MVNDILNTIMNDGALQQLLLGGVGIVVLSYLAFRE
jgi:hypothetical protein